MSEEQNRKKQNVQEEHEYTNPVGVFLKIIGGIIGAVVRTLATVILIVCCAGAGIALGFVLALVSTTEPLSDIEFETSHESTYLYYSDGSKIQYINGEGEVEDLSFKSMQNVNRVLVSGDEIPQNLKNALVAIEDERFYTHSGIDLKRTLSAVVAFFVPGLGSFGGSTITQQLIKNATGDDGRSIQRKIREAWRAYLLEKDYTKDEILEKYLNIIYLGRDLYGVQAASRAYFNKDVQDLSLAECAYLAGITNNPGRFAPYTINGREKGYKRQITILDKMMELGMITKEEYIEAIQEDIEFYEEYQTTGSTIGIYSYFVEKVIKDVRNDLIAKGYSKAEANSLIYGGGINIYTTQDKEMQAIVDAIFTDDTYFPVNYQYTSPTDNAQAAIVIMDQYTGQIKAMYGGYGEKDTNLSYNYATDAKRQPGSSIKPILVYAPLLDMGLITASTKIKDEEVFLNPETPDEPWPKNSYKKFKGTVTIRQALAVSSNVIAMKLYVDHVDDCLEYMKKSGIDRTNEKQLSVALGGLTNGVCALDMCASYVPFSNGMGVYYEPITYTSVVDSTGKILLSNAPSSTVVYKNYQTVSVVSSLLSSVFDSSLSGTGVKAEPFYPDGTKIPAAGKTGTTTASVDRWFVGYTGYYTAAVWYGYPYQKSLQAEEKYCAMNIWKNVMEKIHENLPEKPLAVSREATVCKICVNSGKLCTSLCARDINGSRESTEVFIDGTQPTKYCDEHIEVVICNECGKTDDKYTLAGPYCTNTKRIVTKKSYLHSETCQKCKAPEIPVTIPDEPQTAEEPQTSEPIG